MSSEGSHWINEETADPVYADTRGFFKVEEWTANDLHVARLIYAVTGSTKHTTFSTPPFASTWPGAIAFVRASAS